MRWHLPEFASHHVVHRSSVPHNDRQEPWSLNFTTSTLSLLSSAICRRQGRLFFNEFVVKSIQSLWVWLKARTAAGTFEAERRMWLCEGCLCGDFRIGRELWDQRAPGVQSNRPGLCGSGPQFHFRKEMQVGIRASGYHSLTSYHSEDSSWRAEWN